MQELVNEAMQNKNNKNEKLTKALRENLKKRKANARTLKNAAGSEEDSGEKIDAAPKLRKSIISKTSRVKLEKDK